MIELGKLIYRKREDRADCWYRMARLLIEGIREHAIEGDTGDYEEFRSNMKALEARLDPATPAAEVLVLAGSAVKELENYNRGATRFLSAKASQLEHMVHMLARAVQESTALDQGSVDRLKKCRNGD